MKTLVIASQKGGVAKTTTTTEMAIAAAEAGLAVAIIDTDPQATSCFWAEARGARRHRGQRRVPGPHSEPPEGT